MSLFPVKYEHIGLGIATAALAAAPGCSVQQQTLESTVARLQGQIQESQDKPGLYIDLAELYLPKKEAVIVPNFEGNYDLYVYHQEGNLQECRKALDSAFERLSSLETLDKYRLANRYLKLGRGLADSDRFDLDIQKYIIDNVLACYEQVIQDHHKMHEEKGTEHTEDCEDGLKLESGISLFQAVRANMDLILHLKESLYEKKTRPVNLIEV